MEFLVIIFCVTLNFFIGRDVDRIQDQWFFSLSQKVEKQLTQLSAGLAQNWLAGIVVIYILLLLVLWFLLRLVDGWFAGIITLLVHIAVLYLAFDRVHPGLLARQYIDRWRRGNFESCYLYLQQLQSGSWQSGSMADAALPAPGYQEIHQQFRQLFVYRCFEKMFVMFFWYVVGGPLCVMFCYITYQFRDEPGEPLASREQWLDTAITLLEWIPLRLAGLTFSLAGDFDRGFACLRQLLQNAGASAREYAEKLACCALALKPATLEPVNPQFVAEESELMDEAMPEPVPGETDYQEQSVHELTLLQSLLERSQVIWLCGLAFWTVLTL